MVVFIFVAILTLIIITIAMVFFSVIKLELTDFTIKDYESLSQILKNLKNKQYANIFDHTDFILKLKVCLLKKLTILKFKVSDDGIEKFLRKQIRKNKLKKEEREIKKFAEDDKKEIEEELPNISLERLNLLMNIGSDNASFTALSTTAITILISITLYFLANKIKPNNYNYEINPIYLDKPVFNINASLELSIPMIDMIKLIR